MKAYRLDNGLLEVRELDEETKTEVRLKGSPLFKRFEAGIERPDLLKQEHYAKFWLIVVGEQEDGVLAYFQEESGDQAHIAQKAVEWKDRLLISRFHMLDDDSELLAYLRDPRLTDGLCSYGSDGEDDDGFEMWWHEPDYWAHFRNRDTYAPIIIVPTEIKVNVLAGLQTIRRLFEKEKAIYRNESMTFRQVVKQRPPLQDLTTHPLLRAAVWVTAAMERDTRLAGYASDEPDQWYSNPKK